MKNLIIALVRSLRLALEESEAALTRHHQVETAPMTSEPNDAHEPGTLVVPNWDNSFEGPTYGLITQCADIPEGYIAVQWSGTPHIALHRLDDVLLAPATSLV